MLDLRGTPNRQSQRGGNGGGAGFGQRYGRGLPHRRHGDKIFNAFLPPKRTAPVWDLGSAAPLLNRTGGRYWGCGTIHGWRNLSVLPARNGRGATQ